MMPPHNSLPSGPRSRVSAWGVSPTKHRSEHFTHKGILDGPTKITALEYTLHHNNEPRHPHQRILEALRVPCARSTEAARQQTPNPAHSPISPHVF